MANVMERVLEVLVPAGHTHVLDDFNRSFIIDSKYNWPVKLDTKIVTDVSDEHNFFASVGGSSILSFCRGKGDDFEAFRREADGTAVEVDHEAEHVETKLVGLVPRSIGVGDEAMVLGDLGMGFIGQAMERCSAPRECDL